MKRGLVITGGLKPSSELLERELAWADAVICADSGFDVLGDNLDKVILVIGDFDSTRRKDRLEREDIAIESLSPTKDETDTEMAITRMLEHEPEEIHLLGATGSRLDHSLATVLSLEAYLETGVSIVLIDDHNALRVASSGTYKIEKNGYRYFSLIPLTDTVEISTEGLAYALDHATLYRKRTRGVSNEWTKEEATVEVHRGLVMMIKSEDAS